MKLLTKAGAIFDRILNILIYLAAALLLFTMLSVSAHVFGRYFLRQPIGWAVEISMYCILWMTFLGAAWLLRSDGHVRLDALLNRLKPRPRALLMFATSIIGALLCLVTTYYGGIVTLSSWQRGMLTVYALTWPIAPIQAIICVGSFLLFVQFLRGAYGYLVSWRLSQDKKRELSRIEV